MRRTWFKARTYGWGWTPVTWQGWAVLVAYVAVLGGSAEILRPDHGSAIGFVATAVIATTVLLFICFKTGETPRWRWGKSEPHP